MIVDTKTKSTIPLRYHLPMSLRALLNVQFFSSEYEFQDNVIVYLHMSNKVKIKIELSPSLLPFALPFAKVILFANANFLFFFILI